VDTDNKNKNIPSPISLLKKIFSHLDEGRKKQLKILLILSVFASLAESLSIAMLVPFIGFFINPDLYIFNNFFITIFNSLNITGKKEILTLITFIFILVILLSGYIRLKQIKLSNKTIENITSDFRIKIFKFLINQDYSYHFKHGSNEILSNLSQKTLFFTTMIFSTINFLNSTLITIAIVSVLIFYEPFYSPILILVISLLFFLIFKINSKAILQKGQKVNINQNFFIDIFENAVGYLPEIIIYNLKKFYSSILIKVSEDTAKSAAYIRTIGMSPRILLEMFVIILAIIFIYVLSLIGGKIEENLSYITILAFGAQKCLPLINNIYLSSVNFRGSSPTVISFLDILDGGKKETIFDKHFEALRFDKSIKLENLSYQYDTNLPKIINNLNFEIKKGDKVAIKGETGSGKSTLINIISGLINPTEGKIWVDNINIKKENKKNWQKNISIVPQAIFLNDTSILENIAIAENLNQIDIKLVKSCANAACIGKFIENLENKYNEKIGERGVRLSGGQRQRIGIARALYRNSDLIIMDEPTNALDFETENLVMKSIMKFKKDITIIMISHNANTLKFFNKIINLDNL